jgi:hypothetical protein
MNADPLPPLVRSHCRLGLEGHPASQAPTATAEGPISRLVRRDAAGDVVTFRLRLRGQHMEPRRTRSSHVARCGFVERGAQPSSAEGGRQLVTLTLAGLGLTVVLLALAAAVEAIS